ncbi:MAG: GGDEF domain-containing protein, partial [Halanaerobiales bacterium]
KEENTIYFKTREESLNAVEKGIADYGYGNAYSVGYYVLHNNYKNILTIPQAKESREYSIGLLNGDEILLGIINMALIFIDDTRIHTIVLDVASGVEQKITPGMIFEIYGIHIFMVSLLIILVLLYSVVSNIKAKRVLKLQNKKYEVLSQISNEYLFEYNLRTEELKLSDKFNEIFGSGDELEEVKGILKSSLLEIITENNNANLEFTLLNEEKGVFRVFSTRVFNEMGKIDFIIGKLIDISEDVEERESLLLRSQLDGLTGLYNASTSKELIIEQINAKPANRRDAFVLIDCDDFKGINDQQGHLAGDKVLKILANILKKTFRNTDIIGRIGGDEFCVYLLDVSSLETLKEKCRKINKKLKKTAGISVSIGVALPGEKDTYEDVFKKADQALYAAKNKGKAQCAGAYQEDRDTAENGN